MLMLKLVILVMSSFLPRLLGWGSGLGAWCGRVGS